MIILRKSKLGNKNFSLLTSYTPTRTVHDSINIKGTAEAMSSGSATEILQNQAKVLKSKEYLGKSGAYTKLRERVAKRLSNGNKDAKKFLALKKPELIDALWGVQHSLPDKKIVPVVADTIYKLGEIETKTPSKKVVETAVQKARLLKEGIISSKKNQGINYGSMFSVFRSIGNGKIRKLRLK